MAKPLKEYFDHEFMTQLESHLQACAQTHKEVLKKSLEEGHCQPFVALLKEPIWEQLGLMQRIAMVAEKLNNVLGLELEEALPIVECVAGHFKGYVHLVFPNYVQQTGLQQPQIALPALSRLTSGYTSEYAIRPFIAQNPVQVMKTLKQWALSPQAHVRRLASEACRPKLPWGKQIDYLNQNPDEIMQILTLLKQDSSPYVRKSVANNLNDWTKIAPQKSLDLVNTWQAACLQTPTKACAKTYWIIKHGLRTLLKQGHPQALQCLGYQAIDTQRCLSFQVASEVSVGNKLPIELSLDLSGLGKQKIRLEYIISFKRAQQKPYKKVFKLAEFIANEQTCYTLQREHNFAPQTTRNYVAGEHSIALQINGQLHAQRTFNLRQPHVSSTTKPI